LSPPGASRAGARRIPEAVKRVTRQPVRWVINTVGSPTSRRRGRRSAPTSRRCAATWSAPSTRTSAPGDQRAETNVEWLACQEETSPPRFTRQPEW